MKILLIRPKPDKETIGLQHIMICEPLELEYVSAVLNDHHEVIIIDMILETKPVEYFLTKHKPDLVAITAYISHINQVKSYANKIKRSMPQCFIAVGGVHAEVLPEHFKDDNIDFIINANALDTIKELCDSLEKENDYSNIEGIWEKGRTTQKNVTFNYPYPDRTKVDRYRSKYYYMFHNPCALMKTSFGCQFSCNFCFCKEITNGKYFRREIDDVIGEIKTINEQEIYIVDDNFLFDKKYLLQFCEALDANNLVKQFLIYGRSDFITDNEDVIQRFKKSGLRAVIVGLESCNPKDLDKYNKHNNVFKNEEAVKILKKYDIDCYATLILGIDWTDKDFKILYRWLKKLKIQFINLQPFTPLPGTEYYNQYKGQLIIQPEEYEKWDLAHLVVKPRNISIPRYYWNIFKLYYKILLNPIDIFRLIKRFGLKQNIRLMYGSGDVSRQYLKKIIQGLFKKK